MARIAVLTILRCFLLQVISEYSSRGFEFIYDALRDPQYLENLTGLAEMKKAAEAVDVVDWDDEERNEAEGEAEDDFCS